MFSFSDGKYFAEKDNNINKKNTMVRERKMSATVSSYMVTVSEELKKLLHPEGLFESELIVGLSEILDFDDVLKIQGMLFGRPSWHLAFSTSLEEHSLTQMYRKLAEYQKMNKNENLLIMIKDKTKHVFGVLLLSSSESKSTPVIDASQFSDQNDDKDTDKNTTISLFHCRPFKPFSRHLKEQKCLMKKYTDAFYIGYNDAAGSGLWLNENLTSGRIHEFNSKCAVAEHSQNTIEPQILDYKFEIKALECWSFSYVNYGFEGQQPVRKTSRMEFA